MATLTTVGSRQSMFGRQVPSHRPTTSEFSFARTVTGRHYTDKIHMGAVVDPLFRGEEFQRHTLVAANTPAPNLYRLHNSVGKQMVTRRKNAPNATFGRSSRFGYQERAAKARVTPGPGEYVA